MLSDVEALLTIDELAAATKVPTRTIRQYQTLGLLAPPSRVGRVGRYGPSHQERLAAIHRLQERGYSLAGMRDLFDAWESGSEFRTVVGLTDGQPEAPVDEAAVIVTDEQLVSMVPALAKPGNRRIAVRAGLITRRSEKAQWFVRSPSALATVADLIAGGISAPRALALFEHVTTVLGALGGVVATELSAIEPDGDRTALLQRNRALLGRTVATLLIAAIGEHLPAGDTDRIRIGAINSRPPDSGRRF